MKAWVLQDIGKISFENVPKPSVSKDEVLIRVRNCGICGSDIPRIYRDGAHKMPLITGHEFSGEVIGAGSPKLGAWEGKRVGIFPLIPCKKCGPCLLGHYEMCRNYSYLGSRTDGGFAEYVSVPAWNLIELPENVTFEQAAMLEPMSVAAHAIRRMGLTEKSSNQADRKTPETEGKTNKIAVYGQGTIGLMLLMLLLAEGYEGIYAFGNHNLQKEKACELGLPTESFCDIRKEDTRAWAKAHFGDGADISFEAVGNEKTYEQAVELAAPGGKVCLVGNPNTDMDLKREIYWKILRNQLTLYGTWNSSFGTADISDASVASTVVSTRCNEADTEDDWHYVLRMLSERKISPEKLISHRYPIDALEEGFLLMRDKKEDYIKVMMENN